MPVRVIARCGSVGKTLEDLAWQVGWAGQALRGMPRQSTQC